MIPDIMDRRSFIQLPLVSALIGGVQDIPGERAGKGIRVSSGSDRFGEELLIMGGKFDCLVSAKDTGGDLCIYNTVRHEKGGPPLHLHHSQDEWFYVIEGQFIVKVGEEMMNLGPGDSAFAPRKIPHAFAMTGGEPARMLVLFQPAGSMEGFFREMSRYGPSIPENPEEKMRELWRKHGMEITGPPLRIT